MTPQQEKAREIVDKFYQTTPNEAWYNPPLGSLSMRYKAWEQAKECALIAVEFARDQFDKYCCAEMNMVGSPDDHFDVLKQEIEKL